MKDETVIREYLDEINGFTNTGIWMYEDEVPYCQAKYNKCLAAAEAFGGLDELAVILLANVSEDKLIILPPEDTQGWTPLWVLLQQFQCCKYQDIQNIGYEVPFAKWEVPFNSEALADFAKADASNTFIAEMCMLNAVLMAASEHC